MPLSNSASSYGSVTKTLHWLTALLILSAFPLGYIAHETPFDTSDQLAQKAFLFSAHKTVGIAAFFTALVRILWALSQKRPGLLNAENRLEALAAETAHWLLYGSMLLVPLSGWVHHATTKGFAPIWWPFGQDLPLIPKSEALAAFTSSLHFLLMIVLALTILAHIGGALKHFVIDKDQTLQRMMPGKSSAPTPESTPHSLRPLALALVIWGVAFGIGTSTGLFKSDAAPTATVASLDAVSSEWAVQDGTLEITVRQFSSDVTGVFADWTAAITFDEEGKAGVHGDVEVQIAIGSLTLGSVTQQAMGSDYFNVSEFPTAVFKAEIREATEGFFAIGDLTLRGVTVPLRLPFFLELENDTAKMTGNTTVKRLDFGIGENQPDEANLGFEVDITVSLTATR